MASTKKKASSRKKARRVVGSRAARTVPSIADDSNFRFALIAAARRGDEARHARAVGDRALRVESFTVGREPLWLREAKQLHRDLGEAILSLSSRDGQEVSAYGEGAEQLVKKFVEVMSGRAPDRQDFYALLRSIDMFVRRAEPYRNALAAVERGDISAANAVAATATVINPRLARQLLERSELNELLALLIRRWPDRTARKPTRWRIASDLLSTLYGRVVAPTTISLGFKSACRARKSTG